MTPAAQLIDAGLTSQQVVRLARTTVAFRPGTVTAVLGRNGSGKSTLLGLLSGELVPDSGSIEIDGADITGLDARARARQRALLGQERQVSFGFTVEEVVSWGRTPWQGTPQAQDDEAIVNEVIEEHGLSAVRTRPVTMLSGGERTRVHLARVMAQRAPLLLLDEADADLDVVGRHDLDARIRAHADAGGAVIVVSHDVARMRHVCDDVVLLQGGRVVAYGRAAEVMTPAVLRGAFGIDIPW